MQSLVIKKTKSKYPSMTSLVDVVFILLMFFMLTTSFDKLSLMEIQHSGFSESIDDQENIFIVLTADSSLSIYPQSKTHSLSEIIVQLQDAVKKPDNLIVMPKPKTEVQVILSTLEDLKLKGFSNVTLGELADE